MRRLALAALAALAPGAGAADDLPAAVRSATPLPLISADQTPITRSDLDRALASIQVHFDAIEKAVELAHQDSVRVPTLVDRATAELRELLESKVKVSETALTGRVDELKTQFQERTAAQSIAVEKAQTQSVEALAQLRASFTQTAESQSTQLSDVKSRLDRLDGPLLQTQGSLASIQAQLADMKTRLDKTEGSGAGIGATFGWIVGVGGVLIALASLVFGTRLPASRRGA